MRGLAMLTLIASVAFSGFAWAQSATDLMDAVRRDGRSPSVVDNLPSSDHSSRCLGANGVSHELAIRSCGRVIGERMSRTATATAHYNRGGHYEELGDTERAQEDFRRALQLYTQEVQAERRSPSALVNRGVAYARINDFDRALADYAAAAELSPEWDTPHRNTGYVHFRRADFATALTAFDAAIALDAEDSSNHAGRCETLAAQQNFEQAEAACAEALRLASDEAYPHIASGYLRFAQGRFDEAWTAFDRGVQLDEDRAIAVYARGVSAVRLGRQAEGDADIALARGRSLRAISLYANAGMLP